MSERNEQGKDLFPKAVQEEYDRFIAERANRIKGRFVKSKVAGRKTFSAARSRGPDRSGY